MAAPVPSDKVKDKEYTNWLKVTLALYYMKSGLHTFIQSEVDCLHQILKQKIYGGQSVPHLRCTMCHASLVTYRYTGNWVMKCRCSLNCHVWFYELLFHHTKPKSQKIYWSNSDITLWPFNPWECAKVYMPGGQHLSNAGPADCDVQTLFTLLANCTHFHHRLSPQGLALVHKISQINNKVIHSTEMKLSDADRLSFIQQIIHFLHDPVCLVSLDECKDAVDNIYKINIDSVNVFFNVDLEMTALSASVNDPLDTIERDVQSAMKQMDTVLQQQNSAGLPPEILNMDERSQRLYREALASGEEEVYNIRVMIVGHNGVGKTSLTQRLLGEQVNESETESTEGIEVHTRCCQIDHVTGVWTRKEKSDEHFLTDSRIASILCKYTSPVTNQTSVTLMETDPENGISPEEIVTPLPLERDVQSIPKEATDTQNAEQTEQLEGRTCPDEIRKFVERAKSLSVPQNKSSDVTLLDFAGQSLFYTTHQAFMSGRTLYLIVTDMNRKLTAAVEEESCSIDVSGKGSCCTQEYVVYWLNSIHSHVIIPKNDQTKSEESNGKSSRGAQRTIRNRPFVVLVGTHSDKIPQESLDQTKESYFNQIRSNLQHGPLLFHLVDEDFAISNLGSDPSIDALKSKIFDIAKQQVYWGEKIPARWILLEQALMEFKARGIPVMDYSDVKAINESLQVKIERLEELDLFLRFEHDTGNIIFFNTENENCAEKIRLEKKIVLDPEWLIKGVRIWITSDKVIKRHPELALNWSDFKNSGKLTHSLIEKLWLPHSQIHQHKDHLLNVMEKVNIIAKPLHKEEHNGEEEYYWVPCMVNMPSPDHVKKLELNEETTKTSTLCFMSKTKFIHIGVFHRLLATCLSKWNPAQEGEKYLFFRGFCVFQLDAQQQLLLSLNDFVIQATVIRFTRKGRIPERTLCMTIRDNLYTALSEISECLCPGSELEICIKCKESSPLTNEGLHTISTLRSYDEVHCSTHKKDHCVESEKLLGFWEEDKKQIPANVLPQHSALHTTRFTRLASLVLDVGSRVLREVLLYCTRSQCSLDQYMKNHEQEILKLQQRKKPVLTQAQVDIIFPQSGQTDIKKYDITLASALLNNICHSLTQQDKQIIIDLRTQRNELAHSDSTEMNEQDFQTKLTKIKSTLTNLSKLCNDPNFEDTVKNNIQNIEQSGTCEILSKVAEMEEALKAVRRLIE